jgi:O-antigen/teichoic acid export membrane protein
MSIKINVKAVSGSIALSIGNFVYTAISALGSIVIARLLGPADYGVISIALIYPIMFSGLADLGLSTAIMRYASLGDFKNASTAFYLRIIMSLLFAVALASLSPYLATILQRPYLTPMIYILAIYSFASGALSSVTAFLAGVNRYWDLTFINIVLAVVKVSSSIALILAGYSVYGALWGFSIGYFLAAFYALILSLRSVDSVFNLTRNSLVEVLNYSIPLYIPGLIGIPLGQLYNILRAIYVSNVEIGNYQIANNLLAPINIVAGSISTALFTTLPQLINEEYKFKEAINRASKYIALIITPIAITLALFSEQIVYIIYGSQYELAPQYLSIMALSNILAPFGVVIMYLNIIGATRVTMMLNIINMLIGLPITWILLIYYGMFGAVVAGAINSFIGAIISLSIVKKLYKISIKIMNIVKYWTPSLLSGSLTYLMMSRIADIWAALSIGFVTYILLLMILVSIMTSDDDLINLIDINRNIKYIGSPINYILSIIFEIRLMLRELWTYISKT